MKAKIFLGLMFFTAAAPGVATAYDMRNYYPLTMGDSRTYHEVARRTDLSGTSTTTWSHVETEVVSGTETVQGVTTLQLAFTHPTQSANESEYDNMVWQADGLKIFGNTETSPTETIVATCTVPITVFPVEMEMGVPYSSSFSCEDGAFAATTTRTLEAVETITVEAGTFTDCLKSHWVASGPGFSENTTDWHCPGVGLVKSVGTSQESDEETPESFTSTLRWASVTVNGNVTQYGAGEQSLDGVRTAYAVANLWESRMQIRDVVVGGMPMDFTFALNPTTLLFEYSQDGLGHPSIPGVDLANAYIRMNGADLTIFDVSINGALYFTDWTLVGTPSLGFQLTNFGPMP